MKLQNKSVIVTGGAGFIGSHLVDELIKHAPEKVVIVDNMFLGSEANLEQAKGFENLKVFNQNASDYEETKKIIEQEGIQVVFNFAVIPLPTSFIQPRFTFEENINITLALCELIREDYFDTIIHCSSSEAYGMAKYVPMDEYHPIRPETPYAASKAATDHLVLSYVRTFGIDAAIIRLFNNYGPRQNDKAYAGIIPITINRIKEGKPPLIYGDGKQTRDFLYVGETARATIDIYREKKTRGKLLNIASGMETSVNELVKLIMEITDCRMEPVHQDPRPGDVRRHLADITLAKKMIGFEPKVSMKDGMKKTVEWYMQRGKKDNECER